MNKLKQSSKKISILYTVPAKNLARHGKKFQTTFLKQLPELKKGELHEPEMATWVTTP